MSAPLVTEPATDTWPWAPGAGDGQTGPPGGGAACWAGTGGAGAFIQAPGPGQTWAESVLLVSPVSPCLGQGKHGLLCILCPVSLGSSR